jgi:fibronectin-binding autotransporter adhesin
MKPKRQNPFVLAALSLATLAFTVTNSRAIDYYWDSNGATAGFGTTTGTWGTSAFWSTSPAGTAATANTTITTSDSVNIGTATLNYGNATIGAGTVSVNKIVFGAGQTTAVTLGTAANTMTLGGTTPTITVEGSGSHTISSLVAGTAGIIKDGTGTLLMSASTNTYTGGLVIRNGTINTAANAATVGGATNTISMGGSGSTGATLIGNTTINRALTVNAPTSGLVTLAPNTSGNSLTYSGGITLAGDLTVRAFFTTNSAGTGTTTISGGITGTGNLTLDNTGNGTGVTGATSQIVVSGTTINPTGTILARGDNTGSGALTTISAVIGSNVTTFTKQGVVTVVLSGANAYTGTTTLSAGILRATTSASALGTGGLTISGGTLQLANDTALNFGRNTTISGTSTITADRLASAATSTTHTLGTLSIGAQTLNVTRGANITGAGVGGITFGAATVTGAATFAPAASSQLTLSSTTNLGTSAITKSGAGSMTATGVVSGTGTGTTVSVSAGTLSLGSNANTFSGNIAVAGSTSILSIVGTSSGGFGTSGPLGNQASNYKTVTLSSGGTFRLSSSNYNVNTPSATNVGAGQVFSISTGGGIFDVASGSTFTLDDGSGTGNAWTSSQLQGSGTLTKTGVGSLSLGNGASSNAVFTGQILINQGTLRLGALTAAGVGLGSTSQGTVIASGAGFDIQNSVSTAAEPLSIDGAGVSGTGNVIFTSHATGGSFSGPITLAGNSTIGSTAAGALTFNAGATFALGSNVLTIRTTGSGRTFTDGVISGAGSLVVNGTGSGDYIPRADHTYSGGTTFTAGFLAVDRDSIGSPGSPTSGPFGTGTLEIAGGQMRSGSGASRTIGNALTLSGNTTFYSVASEKNLIFTGPVSLTGADRTLTSNVGTTVAGASVVFSGAIGDGGNNLGLIKAGAGNLTLGGANSYTGGTTVNAGNLILSGSVPSSTALSVNPTTGGGAGFSIASGAANPLTSISALTLGSGTGPVTLGLDLGANTAASDSLNTAGSATAAGTVNINISAIAGFGSSSTYDLITASSGLNGAGYDLTNAPGGYTYSLNTTDSLVQLIVTPAATGEVFWRGNTSSSWSTLIGSTTNWFTDAAGSTNAGFSPGAGNSVNFSAINATNTGGVITTTLDNNFTVNRILFGSDPNGVTSVTVAGGLTPAGLPGVLSIAPSASTDGLSIGSNAGSITISAPVLLGAPQTWSVNGTGANGSSLTVSGPVTGASPLTIDGLVTLSSPSGTNYSGSTTVPNGAILRGGATNSFSANSATTVSGTGILRLNGFSNTVLSLTGNGTVENSHPSTAATLTVGDANNQTFTGILQNGGVGTLGLTKTGSGSLTLSGANTHTGMTTVSAGTLVLGSASTLTSTNNVTLSGTGTLDLNGFDDTIGSFTTAATTFLTNNAAGTGTNTLTITTGGTTVAALVTDGATAKTALRVNNNNVGTAIASNTGNNFSGGLILAHNATNGTRMVINAAITGTPYGTGTIFVGETNTDRAGIYFATADNTLANPLVINTGLGNDRYGIRNDGRTITLSGPITANSDVVFSANSATLGNTILTNTVTGAGGLVIDLSQTSTANTLQSVTLNTTPNANDYAGDTQVGRTNAAPAQNYAASLVLGAANQIPNGTGKGNVTVNNNNASRTGTLRLAGFDETINGLNGNGFVDGGSGTPTLTLGDNNANGTFSGVLQNTTGSLTVTKVGTGTQTFSGASTFAGPLNVNGGQVAFATSPATSGPLGNTTVVNLSGGGLSYTAPGTNALNRPIAIGASTGTLNASNATGILTISSATSSGGNLVKTGPGAVAISGSTSLNGGLAGVAVNDGTLQAGFGSSGVATISVSATGNLDLRNSATEVLTLANATGALTVTGGAQLGFELDGAANDRIDLGASGTAVTSGVITLNLFSTGGGVAAGTYNLISSSSGGLASATYTLGSAPNGFNYTINATNNLVSVTVTNYTPIYWRGGQNLSWNTLGAGPANWTSDSGGATDSSGKPVSTDTVVLSATGAPTVSNTITTTLDAAFTVDSLQFSNVPSGVTAVTIDAGSGGSLVLSPLSTSGGIRVLSGGGDATISAPLTVATSQTWDVDPSGKLIISGNTTFNGAVNKTNSGPLTLGGNNSGSSAFTLSGGTLKLESASALGTGTFTIGAGTIIDASAGSTVLGNNNVQNWNGDFTFTGSNSLDLGTGAVTLNNSLALTTSANSLTVGGIIGDNGNNRSLTKAGAGTLVLTGANTYGGLTTITSGILSITNGSALGSVSGGTSQSGASALELDGSNGAFMVGPEALTINGGGISNTGALRNYSGDNSYGGTITLAAQSRINSDSGTLTLSGLTAVTGSAQNLVVGGAGNVTISGAITTTTGSVTKDGSGTLTLSGPNTYSGATTVSAGTLEIPSTGTISSVGNVILTVSGSSSVANIAGTYTSTIGGGVAVNSGGILNTSGTISLGGTGTQAIFLGTAGGSGTWNVTGGSVSINYATNGWGIGNGGNGTLNVSGGSVTTAGSNTFGVGFAAGGTGTLTISGTGLVTVNPGAGVFDIGRNNNVTCLGVVNLDGGTLAMGRNIVKTGANASATFNFNGGLLRAGLTSTTYMQGLTVATVGNGGALIDTNGFNITVGQALTHLGSASAIDGGLTKSGTGILTVTGANTYTGPTQVNGGTLQLNGSAATGLLPTSGVTVEASGALGYTAAAASTLDLTGKPLTLSGGSIGFDVGAGVNDTITVQDFTLTANSAFTFDAIGAVANGSTYTVLTSANPISNSGSFTISGQTIGRVILTPTINTDTITVTASLNEGIWNQAGGGNWSNGNPSATAGNWTNYKPTVSGDAVLFGSAISAPSTVAVDTPHSAAFIRFDNANAYTIGSNGSNNLTLNNGTDSASIAVTSGSHVIAEDVVLLSNVGVQPATGTTLNISGVLSGASRSVTMVGTGTLELSGANTYSGATTVSSGTLILSGTRTAASGGISVSTLAGQSAVLNISNGTHALGANAVNVGNAATTAATGTVNQSGGAISFTSGNGLLVGMGTVGNQGIFNMSGGSITTFTSTTRGIMLGVNSNPTPGLSSGGGTFNLSGTGVLNMTAATGGGGDALLQIGRSDTVANNTTNAFNQTGGTANVGILTLGGAASGSSGINATLNLTGGVFSANQFTLLSAGASNTSTISIGGTAQVTLPAFPTNAKGAGSAATITFDSTTGFLSPAAASATYMPAGMFATASLTANGAKFNVPSGRDITVAQVLVDAVSPAAAGTLTKSGTGSLTLSGANTYSGGTTISGGIVSVTTNNSALGTGSVNINGGLRLTVAAGLDIANPITIASGPGTTGRGVVESTGVSGTATISGPITINGGPSAGGHFVASTGTVLHLAGAITSASPFSQRDGVVRFSGGGTGYASLLSTGTTIVGAENGLATTATVTLGASGGATLNLNGFNQSLVGVTKGVNAATIGNSSTTTDSVLTTTGTSSFAGTIVDSVSGGTRKVGLAVASGQLTLSGTNTYSGNTTVNGGTLVLGNASALGAGSTTVTSGSLNLGGQTVTNAISVGTGGTLTGSGTTGAATLEGSVTPGGTSVGLITLSTVTVASTSSITLQLPATGTRGVDHDALNVSGALVLDGTVAVDITGLTPTAGQSFDLINSTGPIDVANFNVATDLILPALGGGLAWDTSAFASTGVISIVSGDPFSGWATSKGLTGANNAKSDDPDNDGKNNLYEFAFDGDPLSAANDGKIVGKIGTVGGNQVLTLTLPVRNGATFSASSGDQLSALVDALYYRVEGDEDLATFTDTITEVTGGDATTIQTGLPTLSTGWTYRTFRAPGTVPTVTNAFLRAKVSDTP